MEHFVAIGLGLLATAAYRRTDSNDLIRHVLNNGSIGSLASAARNGNIDLAQQVIGGKIVVRDQEERLLDDERDRCEIGCGAVRWILGEQAARQ
jgi:hypothetical protein